MQKKNLLFIFQHAPYSTDWVNESLDQLLITCAYPYIINVIFTRDSVLQLIKSQDTTDTIFANRAKQLASLKQYEIENIYVDTQALQRFNLSLDTIAMPVSLIDSEEIKQLYQRQDIIIHD